MNEHLSAAVGFRIVGRDDPAEHRGWHHARPMRARVRHRLLCATLALVLAVTSGSAASAGEATPPRELKLSVALGPAFALGRAAEAWAEGMRSADAPSLAVRSYPGATLAQRDPAREFVALTRGAADLAVGSTLFWATQVPDLAVVGLPWIAPTAAHLAVLAEDPVASRLAASVASAGAIALAFAPLGHRAIIARGRALRVPADLSGMAVRIQANPLVADLLGALGAEPAGMPATAAREAFATGRLSAQEGTPAALAASRADAVGLKELTLWGAVAEVAVFAVRREVWTDLPPAVQDRLRDAALRAARELEVAAAREADAALDALSGRGVTVTRLLAPAHAQFRAASAEVYRKWAAVVEPSLLRDVEEAMRRVGP